MKEFVEGEPSLYHLAARYSSEQFSVDAYDTTRNIIASEPCDLSAYRIALMPDCIWHVAVLGTPAQPELIRRIETTLLHHGERVLLPDDALQALLLRRAEQSQHGNWVEHRRRTR